jgi:hypothetical protein
MKIKIISTILLLLLTLSLFATLTAQPAQAIQPLYDVFSLREYKQWTNYNPDYTFSKPSSSILRMMSTQAGLGVAYAYIHMDKADLHNNKIRVNWRSYLDYSGADVYTLAEVYVVNNVHNRKYTDNTHEFKYAADAEHPVVDYTNVRACDITTSYNNGWTSWRTDTSSTLNLNGWNDQVTLMIKSVDLWTGNTVGLEVDYIEILDSGNNVVKTYHFTDKVCMEQTGSTSDYGQLRNPSSVLYGTEDYANMGCDEPSEWALSSSVSSNVRDLFYNTGKYGTLYNYWGASTKPATVISTNLATETTNTYSTVFYKGHIALFGTGSCSFSGCALAHYGVWSQYGTQHPGYTAIADYNVDSSVKTGMGAANKKASTHDLIFIWACGHANVNYVGQYNSQHSSGLLSSWMQIDSNTLSNNGYTNPDYSDHVFIGFDWLSKWYTEQAANPYYNYGHWAYYFYKYLLEDGFTVKGALDQATIMTHSNLNFGQSTLYTGYWAWNVNANNGAGGWEWSSMHVWGDGYARLPR